MKKTFTINVKWIDAFIKFYKEGKHLTVFI